MAEMKLSSTLTLFILFPWQYIPDIRAENSKLMFKIH